MSYDYSKLLGLIKSNKQTQETLSKAIGVRANTLSLKLNNRANFKQSEISSICEILNIPDKEIGVYFFTHEVQEN